MKFTKKNISVPIELKNKLNAINLLIHKNDIDINEYLSNLFITDDFCIKVFGKVLDKSDWKRVFYGLKSQLGKHKFKNNGIFFEYFSNKIIAENFSLRNLLSFSKIDFEDPDKGIDIIFLDDNFKLQFYEVKSTVTENNNGNQTMIAEMIKKAINSLFCKELKNVDKLINAQENIFSNKDCRESYQTLEKMLQSQSDMVSFLGDSNVDFNICLIGEEVKIDEDKLKEKLIEVFNTVKYCPNKCSSKSTECEKGVIDRLIILNIVNVQFLGDLSLEKIYDNIMNKIKLLGVLND